MNQSVNSILIDIELIIGNFILDKHKNEQAACHADSQSQDVDQRINLFLKKVSPGDFEVVSEHI
jgi:hypothetical protein